MTGRDAFNALRQSFYDSLAPYLNNTDEDLHDFCLDKIEKQEKEFSKSLKLNGLPEATYTYGRTDAALGSERVVVSDFGNGDYFFFEISMKPCFDNVLNEEFPDVLED